MQLPITPAYAISDGQTIPHILVYIASPPSSGQTLFNLYLAVLGENLEGIRLFRDLDEKDLKVAAHVEQL